MAFAASSTPKAWRRNVNRSLSRWIQQPSSACSDSLSRSLNSQPTIRSFSDQGFLKAGGTRTVETRTKVEEKEELTSKALRFASHLKNPIVQQLWRARGAAKQAAAARDTPIDLEEPRTPAQSETKVSYQFSSDEILKETYRNPWGQMRFGKILEDADAISGNIAFAHVQDPNIILVTASVDKIRLMGLPSIDSDQHLGGKVTYVGTSSMEIRLHCTDDAGHEWMEAYFTFVATNPTTKRPERIAPLLPETFKEHKEFEAGANRAAVKRDARKQQKEGLYVESHVEQAAKQLLKEAGPLLNMPSLANPHNILVTQTELQSVEIAQPQQRNTANQIFGGFLMRRACELAWSTVYAYAGQRPVFYDVDTIQFTIPVNVGDMLNFHSRVLYSTVKDDLSDFKGLDKEEGFGGTTDKIPLVSVEVEAWIVDPATASAKLSNQFYFTFALPSNTTIRNVLPGNMEQARTMAMRMAADKAQDEKDLHHARLHRR